MSEWQLTLSEDTSTIIPEQAEAMNFVFRHAPLRCVAASWAPMAAAVIFGAIMTQLERESYILELGRCIGGRDWSNAWQVSRITSDSFTFTTKSSQQRCGTKLLLHPV